MKEIMEKCFKCNCFIQEEHRTYCPRCDALILKSKDYPTIGAFDTVSEHVFSQINPNRIDIYRPYIDYTTKTLTKYMQTLRAIQLHGNKKPRLFGRQKWQETTLGLLAIFEMLGMSLAGTTSVNTFTLLMSYPEGCYGIFEKVELLERLTSAVVRGYKLYLRENNTVSLYLVNKNIQEIVKTYNDVMTEIETILNKLRPIYKNSSL